MGSNKVELQYMISRLAEFSVSLGSNVSKRSMAECQFDYLQQEFLELRNKVDAMQNDLQQNGLSAKNSTFGHQIREGIKQMNILCGKMKEEVVKMTRKAKEPPEKLESREKIAKNCTLLLRDIEDKELARTGGAPANKIMTLTDMKAKLLTEIQESNDHLHTGSDGKISEIDEQEMKAIQDWKEHEKKEDEILDDAINGVQILRKKVVTINQKQEEIMDKGKVVQKKINKNTKRLEGDNAKLKNIIKDYRGNRCCLIMVLFLLLIGLVVVILKIFVL